MNEARELDGACRWRVVCRAVARAQQRARTALQHGSGPGDPGPGILASWPLPDDSTRLRPQVGCQDTGSGTTS